MLRYISVAWRHGFLARTDSSFVFLAGLLITYHNFHVVEHSEESLFRVDNLFRHANVNLEGPLSRDVKVVQDVGGVVAAFCCTPELSL